MTVTSQVAAAPVAPGAASHRVPSRRRLAHGWRALRTGVAFASFGVGAIVVAAVTAVSARGARERRELRTQRVVHRAFRLFMWWMRCLRLCRVSWVGGERLRGTGGRGFHGYSMAAGTPRRQRRVATLRPRRITLRPRPV
jgi:hypothetical protein